MRRLRTIAVAAWLSRKHEDDAGQGLAEYGLILALVALLCIGALTAFGGVVANSPGFTSLPNLF